nr:transporter substrate-binding domain-containing protein [Thalassotalea sp. G2M2-11]
MIVLSILLCVVPQVKASEQPLHVMFLQRAPFSFHVNDQPQGVLIDVINEVSQQQNIKIKYQQVESWFDLLKALKRNVNACSLGPYKTKQRELDYKYSDAIYQEAPYLVIANTKVAKKFGVSVSLDELFASHFVFGAQKGFSYGEYVDKKLANKKSGILELSYLTITGQAIEQRHEFSLLNLGRVDYVLMNADEYYWNVQNAALDMKNITDLSIQDPLARNNRYLMCSKGTSDKTILTINEGIRQLKASSKYHHLVSQYKK